jgi:predicted  nucleic acid-binding Zn-ribbon protein
MAIYHLNMNIVSRGKGASVVQKAAYRAAEALKSEYDGEVHDYTRKSGIAHKDILLPINAPVEYSDRSVLWNAVEQAEKMKHAQLAREIEIALPRELTRGQNIALALDYAQKVFVDNGMCADVCIHDKGDGNPHAHILLTVRPINEDGSWGAKSKKEYILDENGERIMLKSGEYKSRKVCTVDWNEKAKSEEWRKSWADFLNAALAENGIKTRVDHRSYARQGVEKIPTVHMGPATWQEKKGIRTELGDINREVAVTNQEIRRLRARIRKAKDWLYSQPLADAPGIIDVMKNAAAWSNLNTRWQKISHLKSMANTLNLLSESNIYDLSELAEKAEQMHHEVHDLSVEVKKIDRRMDTLTEHLRQCEIISKYKPVARKYNELDANKRKVFQEKYSKEIQAYKDASEYLKRVLNGRADAPAKKWEAEMQKLTGERYVLCEKYYDLRDEIKSVETLRRGTEKLIGEAEQERKPTRSRDEAR